ncbi:hypothetical protein [Mycolicibacterium gilvum]|uniref:Uncharacterized protein n=1 Tax=Mycolicibacterium gilvum TaxID=1804 RepID=A0A378SM39_9MYCO|nr:hypothetical protein [Mycolicibacterium gilvum]MCV7053605.1 hypothetical protein [Mycolicibacterium gilvum]STZ43198.1 Uncharacterised protein [Mycolicibacterium gilvum]
MSAANRTALVNELREALADLAPADMSTDEIITLLTVVRTPLERKQIRQQKPPIPLRLMRDPERV